MKHTTIIGDLLTKVRLHSKHPSKYKRCIVFEVGFGQSLYKLRQKAHTWLYRTENVHLVVAIDLREIPQSYINPGTGKKVSNGKAKDSAHNWPSKWFDRKVFELELRGIIKSCGEAAREEEEEDREGETQAKTWDSLVPASVKEYLDTKKLKLHKWLIQQDATGDLIPNLIEPIDGHVYFYRRRGVVNNAVHSGLPQIIPDVEEEGPEHTSISPNDEFTPFLDQYLSTKFMSLSLPIGK